MEKEKNENIKCTVSSCMHHCNSEDYCSLDNVCIGTDESHPTECECVNCESFELKN